MSDLHGTVHWNELMTSDIEKSKAYYEAVCGWEWDTMPMEEGLYYIAKKGEVMIGGMMSLADMQGMENVPPHWMTYLAVDDVDAAVKATKAQGGQVHRAPWDVPGVGRIAMVADPGGAAIGLMTPS